MTSFTADHSKASVGNMEKPPTQEIARDERAPQFEPEKPEPTEHKQIGVHNIEAATEVWSKWTLVTAYSNVWLIYFIISIEEVVVRALDPFVTSEFSRHSLTPAVSIMASIFGGLSKLAFAKILDTIGRPQGISLTLFFWVIGIIMMAACQNVETYAAAQVFSAMGSQGVSYCITIFIADTTTLLNRPLMLAFATSPYIVTPWIGGPVSDSVLKGPGWRWGFGIWAIVTPVIVVPLIVLLSWNQRKAQKQGYASKTSYSDLSLRSVQNFLVEVDAFGLLLLAAGMALFLLPFAIWTYQSAGWKSPMIIAMIIVGGLLIISFLAWEKFFAPVRFISVELLTDRTVLFGGLMFTFVFANSTVWGGYFTSMLLVVWDTGVTQATYISNIYRVGSCFAGLVMGALMRMTGRFKWVATFYALPLMILGVGLMIHFRQANQDIGFVVMTQIFVAFAGGPIVIAGEMAMMAPLEHQQVAVIMAILDLFSSVGNAIGSTVSTAIWTSTFKQELRKRLPAEAPIDSVYNSLPIQLSYLSGTEERAGVADAYSASQRYMLITSTCLLVVAWACTWLWRDINIRDRQQINTRNVI